MIYRNKTQNSTLHALIGELNIDTEQKEELVFQYSNERTGSSSKLFVPECQALINYLISIKKGVSQKPIDWKDTPENIMRRKVIAICHEMHWTDNGKVDFVRLNAFLSKSGYLHKANLNQYTVKELPILITQFEQLQKSFYAKRKV